MTQHSDRTNGITEADLVSIGDPRLRAPTAEIEAAEARDVLDWEGCFSVPGYMGLVPRSERITVRYTDETGQTVTDEITGYAARVFQHEIDHLDGLVYLDRMPDTKTLTTTQNYLDHHRPGAA